MPSQAKNAQSPLAELCHTVEPFDFGVVIVFSTFSALHSSDVGFPPFSILDRTNEEQTSKAHAHVAMGLRSYLP